ncbi:methyl-accepting chemotaxis protein [Marinomonas ostreistagni]|uniref:Methyl-accepting chemotaxis protein n=1 Tax=Marinomonas ostreistagni TaxID=359209 RepID=A0ABS0ZFH2_9GAMM|nr:methyl-accepting chemotaxis protein [Marinomonas ostreistagni]MBJ7552385.1 methyl-accepting chemotaxis protein [Marinomonas ostreistagni]
MLNLSWKQRFLITIVTSVVALSCVAAAILWSYQTLERANDVKDNVSTYQQQITTFSNTLLKLKQSANALSIIEAARFESLLNDLSMQAQYFKEQAQRTSDAEVVTLSRRLEETVATYVDLQHVWFENRETLGLSGSLGHYATLTQYGNVLFDISLSRVSQFSIPISLAQKGLIESRSQSDVIKIQQALTELTAMVEDFGWESNDIGKAVLEYAQVFDQVSQLITKDKQLSDQLQTMSLTIDQISSQQRQHLEEHILGLVLQQVSVAKSTAFLVVLAALLGMGVLITVTLMFMSRQLNHQLSYMKQVMSSVAAGDFSKRLQTTNNQNDELNQLRLSFNHMLEDVSKLMKQVLRAADDLSAVRNQLEGEVLQLAAASEQVERNTEQVMDSTQHISVMSEDVAERSSSVNRTAQNAQELSKSGQGIVSGSVQAMERIASLIHNSHDATQTLSESGDKMKNIVDVINGLADQTNLLALNAAIESARAGEAGRGFSVVADEVRGLAQKTVEATSMIGEIISDFNRHSSHIKQLMAQGIELAADGQNAAQNASQSFVEIDQAVFAVFNDMKYVTQSVGDIAQNSASITQQIQDITLQTGHTKTTRLELEKHTKKLSKLGEELEELTHRFNLS